MRTFGAVGWQCTYRVKVAVLGFLGTPVFHIRMCPISIPSLGGAGEDTILYEWYTLS